MKKEKLELLQALHKIIEIDNHFLTNDQYDTYNKLADKADKENILW